PRRAGGCRVPHRHAHVLRGWRGPPCGRRWCGISAVQGPGDQLIWGATWPSREDFVALAAEHHRVIPVVRRLLVDDVTPVSLYRTLAEGEPGTFIMESAPIGGGWSRWSFVGVRSRATLTVDGDDARWLGDVPEGVPTHGDVLDVLGRTLEVLATPRIE